MEQLTKKQRREQRRQEAKEREMKRAGQSKVKQIFTGVVVLISVVLFVWWWQQPRAELVVVHPVKGNAESQVVIREYSDFQCPACRSATPVVADLMKTYGDQVRFEYIDFPLITIHRYAAKAAEAAQCAFDQDAFWDYHDLLFDRQNEWSNISSATEYFKDYAGELGLSQEQFDDCLDSGLKAEVVEQNRREGLRQGINATPTFYINDTQLVGVPNKEEWQTILDNLLNNN